MPSDSNNACSDMPTKSRFLLIARSFGDMTLAVVRHDGSICVDNNQGVVECIVVPFKKGHGKYNFEFLGEILHV